MEIKKQKIRSGKHKYSFAMEEHGEQTDGIQAKIHKSLGNFQLNLSFASSSRRIGILGASGCGKSMTLKCIAGIERPDSGRIAVNGKILYGSAEKIFLKPQVRRVGYLFQNYALFPTMTVEQNIAVGLKGNKAQICQRTAQMIRRFRLQGLEKQIPGQLSGGQQQRVALARILAYEPEVILLDEPFSALDMYLRDQLQRELMELLEHYAGLVILVSHNRDEVYRMSEELLIMENGTLAGQGETKALFQNPRNTVTARLTGCKNITQAVWQANGSLYLPEWKLSLPLREKQGQSCRAVAIRAHEFSMERTTQNAHLCFPVLEPIVTEDLFEYNISFLPSEKSEKRVDWKISKYVHTSLRNGLPQKLYLKEEDLLLLDAT